MHWLSHVRNPKAIEHLYDEVPDLKQVELLRVFLDRDGPLIRFGVDLPRYADHVPPRWGSHPNTVQMEIDCSPILRFHVNGFHTNPILDFQFIRQESGILRIIADGANCSFQVDCHDLYIQRVIGYHQIRNS